MNERMEDQALACVGCSGSAVGEGLREIILCPWGEVQSKRGTFILDGPAADAIVEAFDRHGTALVIDWEHQTLGGEYASPTGRAPAAGWIRDLYPAPDLGLKGLVEWVEDARDAIRAKTYQFLSPVLLIRKDDNRAVELHSAALTNKPAIPRMERLAATDKPLRELTSMADNPQDTETTPDLLLGQIAAVLGIKASGDIIASLAAILDRVRQLTGDEGEGEDAQVASSVREVLGLARDAGRREVVLAMKAWHAEQEAATARGKVAGLEADMRLRDLEGILQPYVAKGVLNRDYPSNREDYQDFVLLAAIAPSLCRRVLDQRVRLLPPEGRTTPPTPRQQLILKAANAYKQDEAMRNITSAEAAINQALSDAGLTEMSADEARELVIA